jgi:hypothetical protein
MGPAAADPLSYRTPYMLCRMLHWLSNKLGAPFPFPKYYQARIRPVLMNTFTYIAHQPPPPPLLTTNGP